MNQPYQREPDIDIDPEIVELLEPLRAVPERNPRVVAEGRAQFLKQLDALEIPQVQNSPDGKFLNRLFKRRIKPKGTPMNAPRFAFSAFSALALVLIVLFGGAGTTVYASQASLPGDALYPIKTTFEQTQASLAADAVRRADLYLEFASHRLDEAEQLIEQGRFDNIEATTSDFERYVNLAIQELRTVSEGDPNRAAELSRQVLEALTRYNQSLSGMVDRVPETIRERVQNAIRVSNPAAVASEVEFTGIVEVMGSSSWTVDGTVIAITPQTQIKGLIKLGDTLEVHAFTAADGVLTAREIEQTAPGGPGHGAPGVPGDGTPNHTQTPRPAGSHTPGTGEQEQEREQHQERSGTHTPGTGDPDQNREQEQEREQNRDRMQTHTPEPGDGSGDHNGDGGQNGSGSGENCGDCPGDGPNDGGGDGGDSGGSGGDHDGGGGDGGGSGGGGHN